jgi:dipeptidyl aminopeptidase/acylaminoacyl peptidase
MRLLIVLWVLAGPALAAPAVTLEELHDYAYPSELTAAEKAPVVAWVSNDHGVRNVWVADSGGAHPRQLTTYSEDDGQEISSLALSADGSRVVYVRGGDHDANWEPTLPSNPSGNPAGAKVEVWSMPLGGGAPQSLGEGDFPTLSPDGKQVVLIKDKTAWIVPSDGSQSSKRLFDVRGEIESPRWSPDGTRVAFVARRGDHSLVGIFTGEQARILWLAPSLNRDEAPRWSADGRRIAFIRRPGEGGVPQPLMKYEPQPWEIWVADPASGVGSRLWASGAGLRDSYTGGFFEWAAGDRIVFESYRDGWQHLYSLPAAGGSLTLLTPGEYIVEDVALSPAKDFLVCSANTGRDADDIDRRHLVKVNVNQPGIQALTSGKSLEWSPVIASDQRTTLISATAQRPPAPAALESNGSVHLLGQISSKYPSARLIVPRRVTIQAQDGMQVHGQLFMPDGRPRNARAVVFVHGGPERQMYLGWHSMEYYSNTYAINQYLASHGFVVLALNYRFGIGYGHDFNFPAAAGPRGAAEYQDVLAAAAYLKSLPGVDPKRVGIYGGSYGGYLTALALARNSDVFAAGVDFAGVHDWTADDDLKELLARKRYQQPPDLQLFLDTAWQSSPVAAIASWRSPVLLIHGDEDRNVHVGQTVDLVRRLSTTSVHYETLMLPDEQHGLARYASVAAVNAAVVAFLERFL